MSQRMALYFDQKAVDTVSSGISQGIAGILGTVGVGGAIGSLFGGPIGALFGAAVGYLGSKMLSPLNQLFANILGAIVGTGTGFV